MKFITRHLLLTTIFFAATLIITSFAVFPYRAHASACVVDSFCFTWQTSSTNESVTIPTISGGYNYNVDWGDGSTSTAQTGDAVHNYVVPDTYKVSITGTFPRIYFQGNTTSGYKMRSIEQWGTNVWTSMSGAFFDCYFMAVNATDAPNLSVATDLSYMFYSVSNIGTTGNFNSWNVSHITNMNSMFAQSGFNKDIHSWDVSSVTNMSAMFRSDQFNQDISGWDVHSVTNMSSMFSGNNSFNQDISGWDVSGVTDMSYMFYSDLVIDQDFSGWNVSNVTTMDHMFDYSNLSTARFDALLTGWALRPTLHMNVPFSALGSYFCSAATQRQQIVDTYAWTIPIGEFGCPVTLTYSAGSNGSIAITSVTSQTVDYNHSGTPVTAVPDTGFRFVNWSDYLSGSYVSTQNPRTDGSVIANISVAANFAVEITVPILNTTSSAASVGQSSATIGGEVTSNGGESPSSWGIRYQQQGSGSWITDTNASGGPTGLFTVTENSLNCGTTYNFEAIATNSAGTGYGSLQTFSTNSCGGGGSGSAPTITNGSATNIGQTYATLGANITNNGGSPIASRIVYYLLAAHFDFNTGTPDDMNNVFVTTPDTSNPNIGPFTENVTGLTCGSDYVYTAAASNEGGGQAGANGVIRFSTASCADTTPVIHTAEISTGRVATSLIHPQFGPGSSTPTVIPLERILRLGMKGDDVVALQKYFKIVPVASKVFGPKTKKAVQAFQKAHGLTPDGLVGPKTLSLMKL